jgi:DNA-binding protein H-NS
MSKNAKYEIIMAQITELTKKAEALRSGELPNVIEDIKTKMSDYGITITDLQFGQEVEAGAATEDGRVVHRRRKPETKYMDATTGNAWTGRGKLPTWMKEALSQGKTKDDFLVTGIFAGEQSDEHADTDLKTEVEAADGKTVRTRRKPETKYMDAETGNSWTGRGKTPKWLQAAMSSGKTMDQFAVA